MKDKEFERTLDRVAGERSNVKMKADTRYTERIVGKTPNGGDYSIAYYYDAQQNPCRKTEAKFVNIVEYTQAGVRVNECYGRLG